MSFVRLPARSRSFPRSSPVRKVKKRKPKPAWDATVSDLSVYRASQDEIERRKAAHKSKNMDLVQADKVNKKIAKARAKERTPGSARRHKTAILKEVLYKQSQLEEVLARSDRTMAMVKDLFGDDPFKYRGLPNVTVAPDPTFQEQLGSLPGGTGSGLDGCSKLDALSESVMDKSALNDLEAQASESEDSEEEDLQYRPVMDFSRFQKLLDAEDEKFQQEKQRNFTKNPGTRPVKPVGASGIVAQGKAEDVVNLDGSYLEDTPSKPYVGAINDTGKVQKTMARTEQTEREQQGHSGHTSDGSVSTNLTDLRKVIDGLETGIADFERQTGRQPAAQRLVPNSFSGCTLALVDAVTRLTIYLKESEVRLKAEITLRGQLSQDVLQLNALLDALTSDIINTQEEYANLQAEFTRYKRDMDQHIATLYRAVNAQAPIYQQTHPGPISSVRTGQIKPPHTTQPQGSHAQEPPFVQVRLSQANPTQSLVGQHHQGPPQQSHQLMPSVQHNGQQPLHASEQGQQGTAILAHGGEDRVEQSPGIIQHPAESEAMAAYSKHTNINQANQQPHSHTDGTIIGFTPQPPQVSEPPSVDELATQMTKTLDQLTAPPSSAILLTPPRHTNSPRTQGGKFASRRNVQQTTQLFPQPSLGDTTDVPSVTAQVRQWVPLSQVSMQNSLPTIGDQQRTVTNSNTIQTNVFIPQFKREDFQTNQDVITQDERSDQTQAIPGYTQQSTQAAIPHLHPPSQLPSQLQGNGQASLPMPQPKPQTAVAPRDTELQRQIAELNRQHEEAQNKLQSLLQRQRQQTAPQERRPAVSAVSPPISPIPHAANDSEPHNHAVMQEQMSPRDRTGGSLREIQVHLPQVPITSASPDVAH